MITLSQASTLPVNLTILTEDISAVGNVDYSPRRGGRVIPAGQTELQLWIPLIDDLQVESDETFAVRILSADQAVVIDDTGVVTVQDND